MSVNEKMTAIADAIREKTGGTEKLGLDAMAAAVEDVYDAGVKSEYDKFWDVYQDYGGPQNYYQAFAYDRFTEKSYTPKYDIVCAEGATTGRNIFANSNYISDVKVAVYANSQNADQAFYKCKLVTIPLFHVQETTVFTNTFSQCASLENITIGGTMGQSITFAACKQLTHDSLLSIIAALKDYSADTSGTTHKLTLASESKAKLTDAEKAVATGKGWTIA